MQKLRFLCRCRDTSDIKAIRQIKHLSSRVVNANRSEDGGTVVGHLHCAAAIAHTPQDLVHSL